MPSTSLWYEDIHQDVQGTTLLTVSASDRDEPDSPNSTLSYEVGTVSPKPPDAEFVVEPSGNLTFKGCLKYEGNLTVKEGQVGVVPLRLHVTDGDPQHTPAWNAVYTMEGDTGGNFKIETDPNTNDGVLTVIKVKARPPSGPWVVDSGTGSTPGDGPKPSSVVVNIDVEDCNDAPTFNVLVHKAMLEENVDVGTYVQTVSAVDPDWSHARKFVYEIGYDPDGWLKVDPDTGVIKVAKRPDRESVNVVDNMYNVVVFAVDNGEPPMTGSATLQLHVLDQNDNVPKLSVNHAVMCVGDGPTMTNITALDPDNEPFGGPFTFELLGEGHQQTAPRYQNQAGSPRSEFMSEAALKELLHQAAGDAVEGYSPHLYADEGDDADTHYEPEKMNFSDAAFRPQAAQQPRPPGLKT
ncbi:hypothetical protein CRUP_019005 [Coryphaenoides rupestris]|nr:hypothetical protein CRUP_019005 [Coryphaenoides rupestris]